ncbi:MAG: UDP-3-O-(3-hydroxymyristoyl)glucosamine N-acyltransferase [Kiritimatiellae bacterium]|nr:UDP-3-O-(3-hydroxymyristoyl)glucosamine N-acyltransferase [Kiritimatiellia bacterium]
MNLTISQIAEELGVPFTGDGGLSITGIAGLRDAQEGDLSFLANARYALDITETKASAVLVGKEHDQPCKPVLIKVEDPDAAFAQIALYFAPLPITPDVGVHPKAIVSEDFELGNRVSIGPYCVLESGVKVGDGTVLSAGSYIGHNTHIGKNCFFYPHVSIRENVEIGHRVIIHNGTVIGSDGFGYTVDKKGVRTKIPQLGSVKVEDDVEMGANVTIDRARFGKTSIGCGTKIDNLVQIAHNVVIGEHVVLCAQVGISGSVTIGDYAILGGQVGCAGHLEIGEGAMIGAQSGVTKSVAPKTFVSGYPAMEHAKATRMHAHQMRIPILKSKVKSLEKRLQELEDKAN